MKIRKTTALLLLLTAGSSAVFASDVVWYDGMKPVSYSIETKTEPVVTVAAGMFTSDMKAVTGRNAVAAKGGNATICVVELDKASSSLVSKLKKSGVPVDELRNKIDGFSLSVVDGRIIVCGANGRGTAYGLLELSHMAGVSPWIWWGDAVPERKNKLTVDSSFKTLQGASVEYRGIFINDEDWSFRPWAFSTNEPSKFGYIGAKTYKRVFQLLMRLRANAMWPAMHPGSTAFFKVQGAKAVADSCGIAIGTSHCEPILRDNVDEWDASKRGAYNYFTNKKNVQDYWIERMKEVKNSKGNMFTIGMRGLHDGLMEGANTDEQKLNGLQTVINDQQELLKKYVGDPAKQMQVFVPYKEVLGIYERGLKVPDYVTLMWCDDNFGYMTRLSTPEEQKRSGGGGVYYHLSYWGRPHDHLWLATTQPGLIYNEMRAAYDHNVRKLWIVNVHDPKIAGYDLELFLDMAWNINSVTAETVADHYKAWLCREFGQAAGEKLFPAMHEFFRLCGQRRPEFMGWNQVELQDKYYLYGLSPTTLSELSETEFGDEMDRYLDRYSAVSRTVKETARMIRPELKDEYFAAIEYPVLAAAAHATKLLESTRAMRIADCINPKPQYDDGVAVNTASAKSQLAYQEIRRLTEFYNDSLAGGKWRRSMSMTPRNLPVFRAPLLPVLLTDAEAKAFVAKAPAPKPHPLDADGTITRNAADYDSATPGARTVQMLGHSMKAVALPKGGELTYKFTSDRDGEAVLRTALIPTQPNDKGDLRFSVSIDGAQPTVYTLKEPFRSDQWKLNVLRGQALRRLGVKLTKGEHTLVIKAIDSHIVVDQWMIDFKPGRRFYLFPVE